MLAFWLYWSQFLANSSEDWLASSTKTLPQLQRRCCWTLVLENQLVQQANWHVSTKIKEVLLVVVYNTCLKLRRVGRPPSSMATWQQTAPTNIGIGRQSM